MPILAVPSALPTSVRWSNWGHQYCSLLGAVVALVTMVILLSKFNHQPVFEWKGISLNTIISILSVTTKASITFAISECVAQWKWILFAREERLLIDFDRIDGATRGPLGSLRVLLKTKGAYIAQFGALLTLVTIALDPFAQQLIQLQQDTQYNKPTNDSFAYISQTTNYSLGASNIHAKRSSNQTYDMLPNGTTTLVHEEEHEWWNVTTSIPPSMEGAIMGAFYKSAEELRRETLFQCSSGNCTFDEFQTVGICHRCNDVTSQLENRTGDFGGFINTLAQWTNGVQVGGTGANAFRLPNGHFITNTNGCRPYNADQKCPGDNLVSTTFGTGNPNRTVSMKDIDTILWSMSFIYPDIEALNRSGAFPKVYLSKGNDTSDVSWPTLKLGASECALYYCLKNITSIVKDSELIENITEVAGVTRTPWSWDNVTSPPSWNTNVRNRPKPPEYYAPPDEARCLEFHKMWSVSKHNSLGLRDPTRSERLGYPQVQEESLKSLSAHFQQLFRWEDWFNNTELRQTYEDVPGMKDAVGFNGAITGWVGEDESELEFRPPTLRRLIPWSRLNHGNITSLFERMGLSMTNEMRRTSRTEDQARNGMDTMTYKGLLGSPIVLYRVVWPWIALHVTSLVCACIFLLMTIHSSDGKGGRTPLWKSSSLAAIRRGHDIGGLLSGAGTSVRDMEDMARKTYVGEGRNDVEEAKPWIEETAEPVTKPRLQSRTF